MIDFGALLASSFVGMLVAPGFAGAALRSLVVTTAVVLVVAWTHTD